MVNVVALSTCGGEDGGIRNRRNVVAEYRAAKGCGNGEKNHSAAASENGYCDRNEHAEGSPGRSGCKRENAGNKEDDCLPRCRRPLADMPAEKIIHLLQAAAAHRQELKRNLLRSRIAAVGESQAWYEAWGTTLGYSANKDAMQMLTLRAPIKTLGRQAEAILLGTAGFLIPVLPDASTDEARHYHRGVWDSWWLLREQFELAAERALPWWVSCESLQVARSAIHRFFLYPLVF